MYLNGVEITTPCYLRAISDRDSSCFSQSHWTSGVSHSALFIGPLALSPFFTWLAVFHTVPPEQCHHCCVSKEEINSTALKTLLIFSHRAKNSHSCIVALLWCRTRSPDGRIISFTENLGWSFTVLTAHPALCPTDSKRPDFFSGCWTFTEWFNCKQTQRDGYLNHAE